MTSETEKERQCPTELHFLRNSHNDYLPTWMSADLTLEGTASNDLLPCGIGGSGVVDETGYCH